MPGDEPIMKVLVTVIYGGERLDLLASPCGVLFVGAGAEIRASEHVDETP